MKYYYSNIMECLKSAEFPKFIKNLAWELNLNIHIETDETGFIFKRQTTRFKVSDESEEKIKNFVNALHTAVDDYEQQINRCGISGYGV